MSMNSNRIVLERKFWNRWIEWEQTNYVRCWIQNIKVAHIEFIHFQSESNSAVTFWLNAMKRNAWKKIKYNEIGWVIKVFLSSRVTICKIHLFFCLPSNFIRLFICFLRSLSSLIFICLLLLQKKKSSFDQCLRNVRRFAAKQCTQRPCMLYYILFYSCACVCMYVCMSVCVNTIGIQNILST